MFKGILVLTFSLLMTSSYTMAQQDPAQTHFIYNKMMFNPGSTGLDEGFCATTGYRNQWDKVVGAPNTSFLNLEGNMNRFFPGGLGLNFCYDAIGFTRQNNLMLNYSYPLQLTGGDVLGIGLGVGMLNFGQKPTWVVPQTMNDNLLPLGFSATGLDLNFGLYFRSAKNFYVGLSATHLTAPGLTQKQDPGTLVGPYTYQVSRHLYLMGGYKTKPIGPGLVDAQMMLRSDFKKTSLDFNARYIYGSMGYAGLTYRTSDAVALMLGFNPIANLTVGYSYDLTVNKLAGASKGSHEIILKYCYYLPIPPVAVSRHPRWL
jgi:type IX secretion system PorP/SprF family membrane protein